MIFSGLPAAVSQPHFFNADPSLLNEVEGMKPEAAKHQTILDIQPVTKKS
jgi:scavenger receptor class B, member 1